MSHYEAAKIKVSGATRVVYGLLTFLSFGFVYVVLIDFSGMGLSPVVAEMLGLAVWGFISLLSCMAFFIGHDVKQTLAVEWQHHMKGRG